ncbi:hypothetical protein BH09BAC1_BH09BAC1_26030 [soil metagenome]
MLPLLAVAQGDTIIQLNTRRSTEMGLSMDTNLIQTLDSIYETPANLLRPAPPLAPVPLYIPLREEAVSLPIPPDTVADVAVLPLFNPNIWNNLFVSLWQNPAMTAFNEQHNFLLQWEAPYYVSRFGGGHGMFAYDFNVPMLQEKHPGKFNWGTGIYYRSMAYGNRFSRTQFGITHSFSINLKKHGQLRFGLEFFNFYIHPLTEETVDIAPNQGTNTRIAKSRLDGGVLSYGMINLGMWYQTPKYFLGISAKNINTLEGWHFQGDEKERAMPVELYVNGGYHFQLGRIVISPMLEYYSKNIPVQAFRPRINIQSLGGKLITGIGYGSKTVTANAGYHTKWLSFIIEGGVSTHTYGPLKGGWVASGSVIFHFKGKKNQPSPIAPTSSLP